MEHFIFIVFCFTSTSFLLILPTIISEIYELIKYGDVYEWHQYYKNGKPVMRKLVWQRCITGEYYRQPEYKPMGEIDKPSK